MFGVKRGAGSAETFIAKRTQERDPSLKIGGESGERRKKCLARVAWRRLWGSVLRLQEGLLWVLSIRTMAITLEKEC